MFHENSHHMFQENLNINNFSAPSIKTGRRNQLPQPEDIMYCESDGCYTRVYTRFNHSLLFCVTLKVIQNELPEKWFIRAHNSYLINKNYISKFDANNSAIILLNNQIIKVSRRKRLIVSQELGIPLSSKAVS